MNESDLTKKRVMHIDTSGRFYERKTTGIAYKIIDKELHKGCSLSVKLKKELKRDFVDDFAKLYAICIYYLIKESLGLFDVLVICGDEDYKKTRRYLDNLFKGNQDYFSKNIMSLYELRKVTGNKYLRSYADGVARSYRKRG